MSARGLRWCALLSVLALASQAAQAGEVAVAVAANFQVPLEKLGKTFTAKTGHHVQASPGSSGKLYAQILEGAPFDVMLSADAARPRRLEEAGAIVAGSRFTYALGRLVLWSRDPALVDQQGAVLAKRSFHHLAIANPETAPYGAAARQVLEKMKLWPSVEPLLVQGEDIGQTYQFVATGNAELGFVALSQMRTAPPAGGSMWIVPASLYAPIEQQAVLLKRAKDNPAALALLNFLRSPEARAAMEQEGYGVP
jgi:molybdate transport system substrate-binding protein